MSKQKPSVFGIVNKDVSRTRNRLYRVVSAHFPRINGVFFHPSQKKGKAFDNAARTPHTSRIAPTRIYVKQNSRAIATHVLAFPVGIVVAASFAICRISTRAVFRNSGGTKHHNVIFAVSACVALTVRPGMLSVPRLTAVPGARNHFPRIEGRNFRVAALKTIGIAEQITRCAIARFIGLLRFHQGLQRLVQSAARRVALPCAPCRLRQGFVHVAARVEALCVRA